MAKFRKIWINLITAAVMMPVVAQIVLSDNHSSFGSREHSRRQGRNVNHKNYSVDIVLSVPNGVSFGTIQTLLNSITFPFLLDNNTVITEIKQTTQCVQSVSLSRCTCEEQFAFPYNVCVAYGACDNISSGVCRCINGIPADGMLCSPIDELPRPVKYEVEVQLNVTDMATVKRIREVLNAAVYPLVRSPSVNVTDVNITTVCVPNNVTFQCTCEDQYRWSCEECQMFGSCDGITNNTCGCISGIPSDGPFCQSVYQHDFTECTSTTTPPSNVTTVTTTAMTTNTTPPAPVTNATTVTTTTMTTNATTPAPVTNVTTVATTATTTNTTTPAPVTNATTVTTTATTTNTTTPAPVTNNVSLLTTPTTTITTTTTAATKMTSVPTITTIPPAPPNPAGPTTAPTTTPAPTVRRVTLSVTLDLEFTEDLRDKQSERYRELESDINRVLRNIYGSITGFQSAFVTGFRPGSVIADFTLNSIALIGNEILRANTGLSSALSEIADVIGSVQAQYNSPTSIEKPASTFTGRNIQLTCGPPDIDVGMIAESEWKFQGFTVAEGNRRKIVLENMQSNLTVTNVVTSDIGTYECSLKGEILDYVQRGEVSTNVIIPAPNVRLQSTISTQCNVGQQQPLECCVQTPFQVRWSDNGNILQSVPTDEPGCIQSNLIIETCSNSEVERTFTCEVVDNTEFNATTRVVIFNSDFTCEDDVYGQGRPGDTSTIMCSVGQLGNKTAECRGTEWELVDDTCILTVINELLIFSQDLSEEEVPMFTEMLSETVQNATDPISESPATIAAVVQILNTVSLVATVVTQNVTQSVLETVDVIIGSDSRESWNFLNANNISRNTSSELLGSLETLAGRVDGLFTVVTPRIIFTKTVFSSSFMADLNSTVELTIHEGDFTNVNITTVTMPTLFNVMPPRNSSFVFNTNSTGNETEETIEDNVINAAVVLINVSHPVSNVTLSYKKRNTSLVAGTQCVFWNFTLLNFLGAWDDEGCELVSDINDTVTCNCNHLTSFSILMATSIPIAVREILDAITYAGVTISMASLVICLIIEGYIWKDITRNSTAFMRHFSIVNTALCLLIANICFIIGAAVAKNPIEDLEEDDYTVPVSPCSTATFFMHFFYLAVFFWMFVSGLLLFYRAVMVFSHMSKSTMIAIGMTLGYICPLLIAVVTVAVTAPGGGYIRRDLACWLNWFQTKALLAMVVPALIIVFINILIVIVVLFKMLRRGVGDASQVEEKHTLVVIIRCVAILSPLFGLTWSLGVGTMISSDNVGIHIAFAFFNSLQGFFILVFGTLLDSKIRALLARNLPTSGSRSNQTRSTSGGISSSSGLNFMNRLRRNRNIYRVSEAATSSSNNSGASESFVNT